MSYLTTAVDIRYKFNSARCCVTCKSNGRLKDIYESHNSRDKGLFGNLLCPSRIVEHCRGCNSQTHSINNCPSLHNWNASVVAEFLHNKQNFEQERKRQLQHYEKQCELEAEKVTIHFCKMFATADDESTEEREAEIAAIEEAMNKEKQEYYKWTNKSTDNIC